MHALEGHLEFYSYFPDEQIEAWGKTPPFTIELIDFIPIVKRRPKPAKKAHKMIPVKRIAV